MLTRTTTALLDELADPANEAAWSQLDERYRPVLVGFARKLGLGVEDAADAAQEALTRFLKSFRDGKYERGRGRLSSWIIGIARRCVADQMRARAAGGGARGLSAAGELPGAERLTEVWEAERDRVVLARALRALAQETKVDPRTIEAFELLAFRQLAPSEVSSRLGMTANDVYLAKHRCLRKLRSLIAELSGAYESDA